MENSTVFVVIVHYNNPVDCLDCVDHVMKQSYGDLQILIVDNDSEDVQLATLREQISVRYQHAFFTEATFSGSQPGDWQRINLISCAQNHGYGRAVNIALRQMEGINGFVFLLNPDINLAPEALSFLVKCSKQETAVYGCTVYDAERPERIKYLAGLRVHRFSGTVSFITHEEDLQLLQSVSGGCLFAPLAVFREVGDLPTDYFLYWEDTEWCHRAREMGFPLKLCPKAIAFDKGSTTIGKGALAEYYYTYNALKFNAKMSGGYAPSILLSNIVRAGKRLFEFRYSNFHAILKASYHYLMHREEPPH